MGTVYLAEHALLNDVVAVKVLDPRFTENPQIVGRFLNEARAAMKLRHRNLVTIHNVARADDGPYFIVMEYLVGQTLARFLAVQASPPGMHQVFTIMVQVVNCLQWIHGRGVIHRDIKPDNIFLVSRDGDPCFPIVLDLGVAHVDERIAPGPRTRLGTVIGTPSYMAPEQLRGERVTGTSDVFSAAIVVYEMSTGWFPYQREHETRAEYFRLSGEELLHRQSTVPPTDPRRFVPTMSEAWARAVLTGLAFEPTKRPSPRGLGHLLADAAATDGVHDDGHAIMK